MFLHGFQTVRVEKLQLFEVLQADKENPPKYASQKSSDLS